MAKEGQVYRMMIIVALAGLGGCSSPVVDNEAGAVVENTGNAVAELAALSERQQKAVLFRAIRDAGLPCQGVIEFEQVARSADKPRWRARCTDGQDHLVEVHADGTALVVSRTAS